MVHPRARRRRESVLGVRGRLLGLVLIPCLGLAMLGGQDVAQRRQQAQDADALVVGVDETATALDAFIAVTQEYRYGEVMTSASAYNITPQVAGALLGINVQTAMRQARNRVDANPSVDRLLAEIGGTAALRRARASVDRGAEAGQSFFGVLVVRAEEAWTDHVRGLGALDAGTGGAGLRRALQTFETSAELFRQGANELAIAAGLAVPGLGGDEITDGSDLPAASARYLATYDRLVAAADDDVAAAVAGLRRFAGFEDSLLELPDMAESGISLGFLGDIFGTALARDAALQRLTETAAADARSHAVSTGDAAEAAYRQILTLVASLLSITVVMALLVTRSIGKPLVRLARRAAEVSDGELDGPPLPLTGPRETSVLARTLNDAVANLRAVERQAVALAGGDVAAAAAVDAPGKLGDLVGRSVDALTQSILERDRLQRRLSHEAAHDALTGLANRRTAMATLDHLIATAGEVAVLFCDLDGFKRVNDEQGHAVGDALLTVAADRLRRVAPDDSLVARLGGDEFVLAAAVSGDAEALALADRVADALDEPVHVDGLPHRVAVSVGLALSRPGDDADRLLRSADAALYEAKRSGRGRVVALDDALRADLEEQHRLEADLRVAIAADRLEVHYQPVFDTATNRLHGVEALVRWRADDGSLVPPDRFIGAAERSGVVADLDRWVLGRALRQLARWRKGPFPDLRLSVNASTRTLLSSRFVDDVRAALAKARVPGEALVVEVTETALVSDLDTAAERIAALRAMDVRTSIDDFGTGYTSVSHLRRLPVAEVKIDRSFVQSMHDDARDSVLVDLIVRIGTVLAVDVVAEGVETGEQLATLRDLGCRLAQGYLLGRPMPGPDLERTFAPTATPDPQLGTVIDSIRR